MLKKTNKKNDLKIWNLIKKEKERQNNTLTLIASENYASNEVIKAQGSILTNKYAEGYPKKRYYSGCKYIDKIENLAIKRAKKLFKSSYANVQPHSGSQANFAVYHALLKPGDLILGMNLSDGGHLTHGALVNFSGILYKSISYKLNKLEKIDYSEILYLAKKFKPKMIIGGFSSYSGIINWKKMRSIANEINAYLIADIAHISGLIAANLYPSPINYAHVVTSTTHKTLSGPRGGLILSNEKNNSLYNKLDRSIFPGTQGGPLMHVIAAKAIAFKEALNKDFIKYQKQILINAKIMAKYFIKNNFKVVSNETFNHLFVLNLTKNNITGKEAENFLNKSNITVNKNTIPNEFRSAFVTSGIRIGTPAITRRGLKKIESEKISFYIVKLLNNFGDNRMSLKVKKSILEICSKYPIYN
ncbi:MAG: serine hydroxymethyltransferase [Buchnera aphidicola (Periphyllus lyropictus)]|uniref:serine hydroxymethyltransferase n=1 Tax=Buchnera aphidicola TaxID=9 RepID=UPI001ECF73C0|nr:serine hydroxymethyltransferase [Buchnera aphidicola]NIH16605.1 serine hydroxymethyltransferase [Buchnera aphidicola (Periphyllus lyropictus)]USS94518.1 serine hydroxymethyltransferase [Buchnera aphidicola (Periphyllus lyropictus)]